MTEWVAERRLLFTLKGSAEERELVIRVGLPYLLDNDKVNFHAHQGAAGCSIEFNGIDDGYLDEVYGVDLLQALQLAADVEPTLKRLSKKYDIFFPDGEPYFDSVDGE